MIARYVLKSFSRHKARTVIMVLALLVVTMMLVTLNNGVDSLQRQVVEIVEQEAGEHDITIHRAETSPDQFMDVSLMAQLRAAAPEIVAIYPRFQATVELQTAQKIGNASLVARVPEDDLGQITVLAGAYDLTGDQVVLLKVTADTFGLKVGDEVNVSYIMPLARLKGYAAPTDESLRRITRRFTVSGIVLATGLGGGGQNGILTSVATAQEWLGLPDRAERLVVVLDQSLYASGSTQAAIFRVRRIAERLYDALGAEVENYTFALDKAQELDFTDIAFAVMRSVSSVYGFLVMGVVGLLIYSLINTNVEERRRDLAFMRVIGAKRWHLFGLVLLEVALIGAFGVGLGVIAGQLFSLTVVSPLVNFFIAHAGTDLSQEFGIDFRMTITVGAMLRTGAIAAVVLLLAALAPARKAANTKIRYAINPGSADNLQIEDLARLRSRRFDKRVVIAGLVLTIMWGLEFIGTNYLYVQGNEAVVSAFMFGGLALLVIGVSLLFYALTVPLERLLIALAGVLADKPTFFAGPNLLRAKQRNTTISLMVVFSATLPTFLGTMTALEQRNYDLEARFRYGAPVTVSVAGWDGYGFYGDPDRQLRPAYLEQVRAVPGVAQVVAITPEYMAQATNRVTLRTTGLLVQGITGSLADVVYEDLAAYGEAMPQAFARLFAEPDTIIISKGYAEYMDLNVGDLLLVPGTGKDHLVPLRIIGLIERLPGFVGFSRNENYVRWGRTPGLVSLDTYLRLTHDPTQGAFCVRGFCTPAEQDQPVLGQVLIATADGTEPAAIVRALREQLADRNDVWVQSTAEEIRTTEQSMRTMRVLMLMMTILSFITSIFGVFSVVYMAVYVRRLEIGMLKAIGMKQRELVGAFALEAVLMTVSASLAGVIAGTVLGYLFYTSNNTMRNTPTQLTFDWSTTLAILVMVVMASIFSTWLAARNTVRRRVTQILREAW